MEIRRVLPPAAIAAGAAFLLLSDPAAADEIIGNDDPNALQGTGNDDVIVGNDGDDTIQADAGDDLVDAGADDDTVTGGEGDDELYGGTGDDVLDGEGGDDIVIGDGEPCFELQPTASALEPCIDDLDDTFPGDDTITGGDGDDILVGDGSLCDNIIDIRDGLTSEDDPDTTCDDGDDTIDGGDGDDTIFGDGHDPLFSEDCFTTFREQGVVAGGGIPFSEECGIGGDDIVTGGDGDDIIEGGGGDDELSGGTGDDLIIGDNLLWYLLDDIFDDEELDDAYAEFMALTPEDLADVMDLLTEYSLLLRNGAGDDVLFGDAGIDFLLGLAGNDVLCGDLDDIGLLGGIGADIPCPVFEDTLDATQGPVTGDLSQDMRELDDEDGEVDENGDYNPYEFVILVAPTKGTVTFDPSTGQFTYTPDPGATGTDSFQYTLRRRIPECQNISVQVDLARTAAGEPCAARGTAIVEENGVTYIVSPFTRTVRFFLGDEATLPTDTSRDPVALPRTGTETLPLALAGLGLTALGAAVQLESRRRTRQLTAS